jgi:hypothetical protein
VPAPPEQRGGSKILKLTAVRVALLSRNNSGRVTGPAKEDPAREMGCWRYARKHGLKIEKVPHNDETEDGMMMPVRRLGSSLTERTNPH